MAPAARRLRAVSDTDRTDEHGDPAPDEAGETDGTGTGQPGGTAAGSADVDAALARLTAAWPTPELTDDQRRVYRDVLGDLEPAALDAAVESLLREGREDRPPPGLVRERALRGTGASGIMRWLPAAVLAVAVAAAVISIAIAVRGGDDQPSDVLPEADRLEELLAGWDWQTGLSTQSVGCERLSDERAECDVLFTTGDTSRVSVVPGDDPGELVVDVADEDGDGATTAPGATAP